MKRKIGKKIAAAFIMLGAILIIPPSLIVADGLTDEPGQADVAIVPGNTVNADGQPSPRLAARLDKTVELYRSGYFSNIIVSGGHGIEGFDEGTVMRDYLIAHGVPSGAIVTDNLGNTTGMTANNAAEIMKNNNWHSALIVSQYFHISRTMLALSRQGVTPIFSAHADYFETRDLYSIPREAIGYISYFVRGNEG